jgi:heme-degrading monooxygenase HmoA
MVHTLFYSRFRPDIDSAAYGADALRMKSLAEQNPGFVSLKTFTADDGERLTVVAFETLAHQNDWRRQTDHVVVQKKGRDQYYASYRIVVAEETRSREWHLDPA